MSAFVAIAVLLILAALLFVLPPLLRRREAGAAAVTRTAVNASVYRDQLRELEADLAAGLVTPERYDEARREVERRLLEDAEVAGEVTVAKRSPLAAVAIGVVVPVLAGVLYFLNGTPEALDPQRVGAEQSAHGMDAGQMAQLVDQLAQKLRETNDPNPEGWAMLARSYNSMGRFQEAAGAYREALKRGPPDARLLADFADALAMAQGRNLQGEPERLIAQALKLDPQHVKALALAGTVAFEKKNYREAAAHWEKILTVVPPGSDIARSVQSSIDEARSLGGFKGGPSVAQRGAPADATPVAAAPVAAAAGRVAGEVQLAPALASRIAPGDTLFIFARPVDGSRMPLAILRKTAGELPVKFELTDGMAMTPQGRLSAHPNVIIGARVSKAGSATPQPGDLEGVSKPVKVGAAGTVIVIDTVVK